MCSQLILDLALLEEDNEDEEKKEGEQKPAEEDPEQLAKMEEFIRKRKEQTLRNKKIEALIEEGLKNISGANEAKAVAMLKASMGKTEKLFTPFARPMNEHEKQFAQRGGGIAELTASDTTFDRFLALHFMDPSTPVSYAFNNMDEEERDRTMILPKQPIIMENPPEIAREQAKRERLKRERRIQEVTTKGKYKTSVVNKTKAHELYSGVVSGKQEAAKKAKQNKWTLPKETTGNSLVETFSQERLLELALKLSQGGVARITRDLLVCPHYSCTPSQHLIINHVTNRGPRICKTGGLEGASVRRRNEGEEVEVPAQASSDISYVQCWIICCTRLPKRSFFLFCNSK